MGADGHHPQHPEAVQGITGNSLRAAYRFGRGQPLRPWRLPRPGAVPRHLIPDLHPHPGRGLHRPLGQSGGRGGWCCSATGSTGWSSVIGWQPFPPRRRSRSVSSRRHRGSAHLLTTRLTQLKRRRATRRCRPSAVRVIRARAWRNSSQRRGWSLATQFGGDVEAPRRAWGMAGLGKGCR